MTQSYLETNTEKFYDKVYEEFGKTRKEVEQYVDILRTWCQEQPHFPEIPTKNACLYSILISKFSIENAKKRADMYFTIRGILPDIFTIHPLSPDVVRHSKISYCIVMPKPTKNHERIFYIQLNPNYKPIEFKIELLFAQINHMVEMVIQEDKCYNFHIIFDTVGAKVGHIARSNPMVLKNMAICFEKVYGYRTSAIYVVNTYPYLDTFVNKLCTYLVPEKVRNRIEVHRNTDVLFKVFDKTLLPKDIGGEGPSLEELRQLMLKEFERMKSRFDHIQYMKIDEPMRRSELQNDDILGYYGNFKQLDLD